MKVVIPFQTDGSGNATVVVNNAGVDSLFHSITVNGGNLTGGTLTLTDQGTEVGYSRTIFSLAAANTDAIYYPRRPEHDNAGVALSNGTTTLMSVFGNLQLTIAGGGANKSGKVTLHLV